MLPSWKKQQIETRNNPLTEIGLIEKMDRIKESHEKGRRLLSNNNDKISRSRRQTRCNSGSAPKTVHAARQDV